MVVQISIRTTRLKIIPFADEHLTDVYIGWLNNSYVVRYSEQRHREHNLQSCREFADRFKTSNDSFCAIEADDLGHIGNLIVTRDAPNQTADLSIMIGAPSAQGQGYGTEAWGAVLAHLLEIEGLRKVTAGTMAANIAMVRIMKKAGMTIEGVRPKQFLLDGVEMDLVFAGVCANNWKAPAQ